MKKSRVAHTRIDADGNPQIVAILPPRLPRATPAEIRKYIAKPADFSHLDAAERAPDHEFSPDERLLLEAQAQADRKDAAVAELSRAEMMQQQAAKQAAATTPTAGTSAEQPAKTEQVLPGTPKPAAAPKPDAEEQVRNQLRGEILAAAKEAYDDPAEFKALVQSHGAAVLMELPTITLRSLLDGCNARIAAKKAEPPFELKQEAATTPQQKLEAIGDRMAEPSEPKQMTPEQANALRGTADKPGLLAASGWPQDDQRKWLEKHKISAFRSLNFDQAADLIAKLEAVVAKKNGVASRS